MLATLIATMTMLATPVAHAPNLVIQCDTIEYAGLAYPQESPPRIVISAGDCEYIERIIKHRRFAAGTQSLRVLLHEAAHIAQGANGPWNEHDAECNSLAALPLALHTLNYDARFINQAIDFERFSIAGEQTPYGGTCPVVPKWNDPTTKHSNRKVGQWKL